MNFPDIDNETRLKDDTRAKLQAYFDVLHATGSKSFARAKAGFNTSNLSHLRTHYAWIKPLEDETIEQNGGFWHNEMVDAALGGGRWTEKGPQLQATKELFRTSNPQLAQGGAGGHNFQFNIVLARPQRPMELDEPQIVEVVYSLPEPEDEDDEDDAPIQAGWAH